MDSYHKPVLIDEVVEALNVEPGKIYIDGTIGGGGHSAQLLKSNARVLGIDRDEDAILHLKKKFESEIASGQLTLVRGNFADIKRISNSNGFETVDGILLDLGVSSNQIDKSGRGFSLRREEPLDMRMDEGLVLTARDLVNNWSENDLYEIIAKYGEEINARKIAQNIIERRKIGPIETTSDLSEIISRVVPSGGKIHPATKTFQALRIIVNDEMNQLKSGLEEGFKLLNKGARFAVISFHSLEDRAVKLFFADLERRSLAKVINKKPIIASITELRSNRRARSAKLRIIEKL